MTAMLEAALAAHAAGLCVLPPKQDGTKAPDVGSWTRYQRQRPTDEDVLGWYANGRTGVGVLCGAVSGGIEMLELEGTAVAEGLDRRFREACRDLGVEDALDRVMRGYVERTPKGGLHLVYRVPTPRGNTKLARRPTTEDEREDPDDRVRVLMETRGEGGYVVTAPSHGSVHPTGLPYVLLAGSFSTIADVTDDERDALWAAARTLDRMPPQPAYEPRPRSSRLDPSDGPIARYNARPDIREVTLGLLERHGWTVVKAGRYVRLRRPGKDHGESATFDYHGDAELIVWSSSTPFDSDRGGHPTSYDPAGVLAVLEHGEDFAAMGRALAEAEGPAFTFAQEPPPEAEDAEPEADGEAPPEADAGDPGPAGAPPPEPAVRRLDEVSTAPPAPLKIGWLDPEGHTVLFGDGGVGKGAFASHLIVRLVDEGETVLVVDYEDHATEWARRVSALGAPETLQHVYHVSPLSHGWSGPRGAIWGQAASLRAIADRVGATYVVVDSVVVACGSTDVMDPEAPAQYAGALQVIGRPAMSLAHATKAGDGRYPFGSIFWHNLCRLSWSMAKAGGQGHRVVVQSRKHNNYGSLGKHLVVTEWMDGKPREVSVEGYAASLADDIAEVLPGGSGPDGQPVPGMTIGEVVDRLNDELEDGVPPIKGNSVRTALRRGVGTRFTVTGTGTAARWSRRSDA